MNTDKTTMTASVSQKYTLEDVGCYVDGARGIHAINKIGSIAKEHGFQTGWDDLPLCLSDYEFAGELEDEIDQFMDADYGVEGAYWGRNDQGDWGLWTLEGTIQ
jgi:hypothetical protein